MFASGEEVEFRPGTVDPAHGPTATVHDGAVSEGNHIQVRLRNGKYMWVDVGEIRKHGVPSDSGGDVAQDLAPMPRERTREEFTAAPAAGAGASASASAGSPDKDAVPGLTSSAPFYAGEEIEFRPGAVKPEDGPTATVHDGTVSEGNHIQVRLKNGLYLWVDAGGIRKRGGPSDSDGVIAKDPEPTPAEQMREESAVVPAARGGGSAGSPGASTVPSINSSAPFYPGEEVELRPGSVKPEYGPTATVHDGTVSEGNHIQVRLKNGLYLWIDAMNVRKITMPDPALLEDTLCLGETLHEDRLYLGATLRMVFGGQRQYC